MRRAIAAALLLALSGCTYKVYDPDTHAVLATCHDGAYTSFCVLDTGKDRPVVSGAGIVPTANTSAGLVTEGVAIRALLKK